MTKRGQVSVPSEVRKKLKIGPNTTLEWVVEGNTARVIPLPSDPVSAFRGSGKRGMVKRLLRERQRDALNHTSKRKEAIRFKRFSLLLQP
jgi:AbrB family looped-hinge helix DNA binding protein